MTALSDSAERAHRLRDLSRAKRAGTRRLRLPSAVVYGSLDAGMMMLLGLLFEDRARFEAAAVAWHGRWCKARGSMRFVDSSEMLSALQALAGPDPVAAARALSELCREQRLHDVAEVLDGWCTGRSGSGPDGPVAA